MARAYVERKNNQEVGGKSVEHMENLWENSRSSHEGEEHYRTAHAASATRTIANPTAYRRPYTLKDVEPPSSETSVEELSEDEVEHEEEQEVEDLMRMEQGNSGLTDTTLQPNAPSFNLLPPPAVTRSTTELFTSQQYDTSLADTTGTTHIVQPAPMYPSGI
ncbi:hypothetical protein FRC12_021715 [Ceratobasidium sp. 428]|nr:hypothetical protein FRC09_002967 [Ceratobasidium sp. 395]KAG8794792.1 hypothetical protein FRC12_021715 [Ceratobasidium sp. 428]